MSLYSRAQLVRGYAGWRASVVRSPKAWSAYVLGSVCALAVLAAPSLATAESDDPLLSTELEFTNREVEKGNARVPNWVATDVSIKYKNRFKARVMEKCPGCTAERKTDRHGANIWRISFPDGWWFEVTTDPYTIEVKTKPSTAKQLRRRQGRIQKHIFDVAHQLGMIGRYESTSAAHMHVGVRSAFGKNTMAFRNFLVDQANFPALAAGVLHRDFSNAPPLTRLDQYQIDAFEEIVNAPDLADYSIEEVAEVIRQRVHHRSVEPDWGPAEKFHATNVIRIDGERLPEAAWTAEVRALPAHESAESMVRVAELLDARIRFLQAKYGNRRVPFRPKKVRSLTPTDHVDQFFQYVVEAGLDWHRYVPLMAAKFRSVPPSLKIAQKMLGGPASPKFLRFVRESLKAGVYDKAALQRWVSRNKSKYPKEAARVERALKRAKPPVVEFEVGVNQPVPKYAKQFLKAERKAGARRARSGTRLQRLFGDMRANLKPVDKKTLDSALGRARKPGPKSKTNGRKKAVKKAATKRAGRKVGRK